MGKEEENAAGKEVNEVGEMEGKQPDRLLGGTNMFNEMSTELGIRERES